jgi:hypothetical protein
MRLDPATPQLLIHFNYYCHLFGAPDLDQFIALWHAADITLRHDTAPPYTRHHIPDLRITTTSPHITFIRQRLENGRGELENSSGGLENSSRDIN